MAGFSVVQAVAAASHDAAAAAAIEPTTHPGGATEAADGKGSSSSSAMLPAVLYSPAVAQLLQAPDLVPVKSFVSTALAAKLKGNAVNYRHIVETIRCVRCSGAWAACVCARGGIRGPWYPNLIN